MRSAHLSLTREECKILPRPFIICNGGKEPKASSHCLNAPWLSVNPSVGPHLHDDRGKGELRCGHIKVFHRVCNGIMERGADFCVAQEHGNGDNVKSTTSALYKTRPIFFSLSTGM